MVSFVNVGNPGLVDYLLPSQLEVSSEAFPTRQIVQLIRTPLCPVLPSGQHLSGHTKLLSGNRMIAPSIFSLLIWKVSFEAVQDEHLLLTPLCPVPPSGRHLAGHAKLLSVVAGWPGWT